MVAHVGLHLRVHPLGGAPERELPERDQVALPEEVPDRLLGLLRQVDLALLQSAEQLVGREIHQLDLVGPLEHGVGDRLAHDHAGDLGHDVVQALDVLDVERRVHGDPGVEQLEHVLPPLGMAGARGIGVRQLVDEDDRRPASQRGVQVELLEGGGPVGHDAGGQDLEPLEQRFRLGPPVGLDAADDNVHPVRPEHPRRLEHRVRLADAGGGAEEELEPPARLARLLFLGARQQGLGIGSVLGHRNSLCAIAITILAPPGQVWAEKAARARGFGSGGGEALPGMATGDRQPDRRRGDRQGATLVDVESPRVAFPQVD